MKNTVVLLVLLELTSCLPSLVLSELDTSRAANRPAGQPIVRARRAEEIAVCGRPLTQILFAAGGTTTLIQNSPWHVGVYIRSKTGEYVQVCGGTLISRTFVISAAHCFYDESYRRYSNTSLYKIGLGKQYRAWEAEEEHAQYRDVAELYTPKRYRGSRGHFNSDIALVELASQVDITSYVNRICVDWEQEFESKELKEENFDGVAVGWGKLLNGTSSETLQAVYLPYVPFDTCFDALPDHAKDIFTSDKFCAGHLDKNTSVCQGDSGGGLTSFRWCDRRSYLRGIVSVSFKPAHNNDPCYAQLYTGFTRVSAHLDWIKQYVDMGEIKETHRPSDDCIIKAIRKSECHIPKSEKMCNKFARMFEASQDGGSSCVLATEAGLTERQLSSPKEFPHMAALGYGVGNVSSITWNCDGSLISERYVLTAAHCLRNRKGAGAYWARLGDWSPNPGGTEDPASQQLIEVAEKVPHHLYNPATVYHNIALLRLKEAVVINAYVRPACLDSLPPVTDYTLSGWGKDTFDVPRSGVLMNGAVRLQDADACNLSYSSTVNKKLIQQGIDHNTMMCFQPVDKQTDCVAVGGAPVQKLSLNQACMHIIVGVVSFGPARCGTTDKPFVTSRVYFYREWIESIVWPELDF